MTVPHVLRNQPIYPQASPDQQEAFWRYFSECERTATLLLQTRSLPEEHPDRVAAQECSDEAVEAIRSFAKENDGFEFRLTPPPSGGAEHRDLVENTTA